MATKTSGRLRFTVSGPDIDRSYETAGVAQSAAITFAGRSKNAATFYVRDVDGVCVARVETDGKTVRVHSGAGAKRDAKWLNVTRSFGPVAVQVYTDASKVGEPRTALRMTAEWELHDDVRAALGPLADLESGREPADEETTRRGPHIMDARDENDRTL